jgi:protein tyrosine phosphatase (PTP) superfamily phosphohydrolase (DUF442 family)
MGAPGPPLAAPLAARLARPARRAYIRPRGPGRAGAPPIVNPFPRLRRAAGEPRAPREWSIADPAARRRASLHYHLKDHAILRTHWTNFDEVAPGVWRSNQPTHKRLMAYKEMGFRTILNLRGTGGGTHVLFLEESCRVLGLTLRSVALVARRAPEREQVLELFRAFREVERPFLMHCKSGADRTGFASALYVLAHRGATVAQARRHLSFRYLHLRATRAGILDHILDLYEARRGRGPVTIEDWFAAEYDATAVDRSFAR